MEHNLKIGDLVIWHNGEGVNLGRGIIVGIRFTSPMGNVYKVNILHADKKIRGSLTRCINQQFLKKIEK